MKVFDCILFFNEFDLLDLRLRTLDSVVDTFVIVEAPWTFSGKPKLLYFKEFHDGYGPWLHKIRHIQLSGAIDAQIPWEREWASRNAMVEGLWDAEADDLVFQSDTDEIWRPEKRDEYPNDPIVTYEQSHNFYNLNTTRLPEHKWLGTRRCKFGSWPGGQKLRDAVGRRIEDGGWHFSYLGDEYQASAKLQAFSHTEYSGPEYSDPRKIRQHMDAGTDLITPLQAFYIPVPVDATFPKPVLENPDRWKKYIKPVA
jgi:beta-1,4-mannosyl-glycoprotein beta-1,4-N-acetylglucosaminyltransferase